MTDILKQMLDDMETMRNIYPTQLLKDTKNSEQIINTALQETQNEFLLLNPDIDKEHCDFYNDVYKKLNPRNELLFHAAFFYGMVNEYKKLLNQKYLLKTELPLISKTEYQNMSKIYRGAFTPYDENHYILRVHSTLCPKRFLSLDKKTLRLFKRALHIIYTIQDESADIKYDPDSMFPLFADDPKCNSAFINWAYLPEQFGIVPVERKRIKTLEILYSTFSEIDKNLSFHENRIIVNDYKKDPIKNRHGAWDIYIEYQNELTHKNFFANSQEKINLAKKEKKNALTQITKSLTKQPFKLPPIQKRTVISEYKKTYQQIILETKEKVLKKISKPRIV